MKNILLIFLQRISALLIATVLTIPFALAQNTGNVYTMVIVPQADTFLSAQPNDGTPGNELLIYSSREKGKVVHEKVAYLQFGLGTIPANAQIRSAKLLLYLKHITDTDEGQIVNVYDISARNDAAAIGTGNAPYESALGNTATVEVKSASIGLESLQKPVEWNFKKSFFSKWQQEYKNTIHLLLAANREQCIYFNHLTVNMQPRLVITYSIDSPTAFTGTQYKCDAQHTGQYGWRSNAYADSYIVREFRTEAVAAYKSVNPILCNGQLIAALQNGRDTTMHKLVAINEKGHITAENKTLNAIVKWQPVADRNGNIYCLTGHTADMLHAVSTADSLKTIHSRKILTRAQVNAMPVIGTDGSLYLSTTEGLLAYTPLPQFRLKWHYRTDTFSTQFFGTAALSGNEDAVYVSSLGDNSNKLLAISNIDGHLLWRNDTFSRRTSPDNMPVPSVKGNKIYLTGGHVNDTALYMADAATGRRKLLLSSHNHNNRDVSQPVITDSFVYVIGNNALVEYNYYSADKKTIQPPRPLNAASSIAADGNGDILALSSSSDSLTFTTFSNGQRAAHLSAGINNGALLAGFLIPTPSGNIITGSKSGFYVICPTSFSVKTPIKIPAADVFESGFLHRSANTITVQGKTLTAGQEVRVHSLKEIKFQKGFRVQKGAQFICKTGI